MNDRSRLPLHRAEDHIPLTPDELSRFAQLSRAFVQVCLDAGCELTDGKISQAMLLNWLAENYVAVRKLAGLPELASIEGVEEPAYTDLQMANMMLTMLEFARSRATRLEEKSQITSVMRLVHRAVEC
ncbi:MAG TPA: hypothetical protein VF614_17635 [Chthoniobacteraceae bacterium]|jgi:hypothetical protein